MERVLLLDKNWSSVTLVPWKKALKLMVKGKVEAVQESSVVKSIGHSGKTFDIPSIVRLLVSVPWRAQENRLRFSRKNLMIRDEGQCAYCGRSVDKHSGTIDHVLPKSRGGKTDYLNCVLCCKKCNGIKSNRTPEEAGLKLQVVPRKPNIYTIQRACLLEESLDVPEEWWNYLNCR